MNTTKLVLVSTVLALIGLALALVNDLGLIGYLGIKPSVTGILALVIATAAFFVAMRKESFLVSGSLIVQGLANVSASILAGAVIGIPFGASVLALGVVKLCISARFLRRRMKPMEITSNLSKSKGNHRSGVSRLLLVAILIVVIAVSAVAVLYISSSGSISSYTSSCNTTSTANANSFVQVSIINGAYNQANAPGYSPDKVTLVMGVNSTIVWKNNDSVHHTVTTTSAPSGAGFSSGDIRPGSCFTHAFTTVGTYKYYCAYHAWMTGEIVVLNSTAS